MDYVYVAAGDPLMIVMWGPVGSTITLRLGDTWPADDPFVQARPDLFSAAPTVLQSSDGRPAPEAVPLGAAKKPAGVKGRRG